MNWTLDALRSLITDQVEESLTLEYKAAAALGKTDAKKTEISKDVSAFANSAGGTIIYGIREYDQPEKQNLPAEIDPVDQSQFSKEWLEHVVGNIRPRIQNLVIHPISAGSDTRGVIYVVEIPQSSTAHQALDLKYYKRYNFESKAMYDHELRDVLGRGQHPLVALSFEIVAEALEHSIAPGLSLGPPSYYDSFNLKVRGTNSGSKYAHYVNAILLVPTSILSESELMSSRKQIDKDGATYTEFFADNTYWSPKHGPGPYEPILPTRSMILKTIYLVDNFDNIDRSKFHISWSVYADNASPMSGEIALADIPFVDIRGRSIVPES